MFHLAAETSLFQCSGRWIYIFNLFAWIFWIFLGKNKTWRGTRAPRPLPKLRPLNTRWPSKKRFCLHWQLVAEYTQSGLGYLLFTWKNRKFRLENGNGSRPFFWEVSENMGCDLRRCNFSTLFSLLCWYGYNLQRIVLLPRQISLSYVCTQDLTWWFM